MAPTPTPTPIPVFAPAVSPLPEFDADVSDEALEVDGAVSVVDVDEAVDEAVDVAVDVDIDVDVGVEVADVTAYSTFQPHISIAPTVELAVSVVVAIVNESESSEVDP